MPAATFHKTSIQDYVHNFFKPYYIETEWFTDSRMTEEEILIYNEMIKEMSILFVERTLFQEGYRDFVRPRQQSELDERLARFILTLAEALDILPVKLQKIKNTSIKQGHL